MSLREATRRRPSGPFNRTEFNVCHDRFLTPTAKYCDVVLPATTFLERNDIVSPNSGNYLLFSNRVSEPIGESRNDYDIFCGLAQRLGFLNEFSEGRDEDAWLRSFAAESNIGDYDEFRRIGIWVDDDQRRSGLTAFIKDPSGQPLATPSGESTDPLRSLRESGRNCDPSAICLENS